METRPKDGSENLLLPLFEQKHKFAVILQPINSKRINLLNRVDKPSKKHRFHTNMAKAGISNHTNVILT